jgi:hypothetical protein
MQEPQTGLTSPICRTPPGQENGHPPDSSRADLLHPGFDVTLLSNDTSAAIPENEDCAPSSRSPPDASRAPFPHRSPRRSSANAACGGLQPPSARAAAKGQTFISCTAPCRKALPTNRTPFHVRGTRRISKLSSNSHSQVPLKFQSVSVEFHCLKYQRMRSRCAASIGRFKPVHGGMVISPMPGSGVGR